MHKLHWNRIFKAQGLCQELQITMNDSIFHYLLLKTFRELRTRKVCEVHEEDWKWEWVRTEGRNEAGSDESRGPGGREGRKEGEGWMGRLFCSRSPSRFSYGGSLFCYPSSSIWAENSPSYSLHENSARFLFLAFHFNSYARTMGRKLQEQIWIVIVDQQWIEVLLHQGQIYPML